VGAQRTQFELANGASVMLPPNHTMEAGRECVLGVRPEHLLIGAPGLALDVEMVEALGADVLVHATTGGQSLVIRAPAGIEVTAGDRITAGFHTSSLHWFDQKSTMRID
jgi:sn-glycerol 3-phosphate transport system ATP-binding protein